jgi:hypothetical protein
MSEKSFAVASVSVAIVWGTFFYPPAPRPAGSDDARPAITTTDSDRVEHARSAPPPLVLIPVAAKQTMHNVDKKMACAPGVINRSPQCSIAQN